MTDGPLADLLVLDLTRALAGPHAAMMLGDMGAGQVEHEQVGEGSVGHGPDATQRRTTLLRREVTSRARQDCHIHSISVTVTSRVAAPASSCTTYRLASTPAETPADVTTRSLLRTNRWPRTTWMVGELSLIHI